MKSQALTIDPYFFEHQFERFRRYVINESGLDLVSFNSNPYTEGQEGYKYEIHSTARKILDFGSWSENEIGKGQIIKSIIRAIELKKNNLVQWESRFGDNARQHQALYVSLENAQKIVSYEKILFSLFRDKEDATTFESLQQIFGHKYPIIAYLFFLKDRTRFMPIAPSYFDKAFKGLGVNFVTSRKCSWENYQSYNSILGDLRILITEKLQNEISLLDAHSFTWILAKKLLKDHNSFEGTRFSTLSNKDKEAIVKARIGQGRFRNAVINYWSKCAVTGCTQLDLLIASHIKPWIECTLDEAIDPYNGILLSPSLDSAFDAGYITFLDEGEIVISKRLSDSDCKALGINASLQLHRVNLRHLPYLEYHRKNVFEKFEKSQEYSKQQT